MGKMSDKKQRQPRKKKKGTKEEARTTVKAANNLHPSPGPLAAPPATGFALPAPAGCRIEFALGSVCADGEEIQ